MDELVDVPELQLDRGADVVVANDRPVGANDLQRALELTLVVVGDLEHEEIHEEVAVALVEVGHGYLSPAI